MPRPNFLFILIDDLGWRDLSCYGSTFYETPHLDRLAAQGVQFTRAYASCPVCSPTRASILTGKCPARVGVTQYIGGHAVGRLCDVPYFAGLPLSEMSLAASLREHGYQTWHVGKWHLGGPATGPERHGFDVNLGGCGWGHPHNGYFSPYGIPNLSDGPAGEYLTDRLTDEAIALIRTRGGRPFFLNLWHYAVHVPIQSPPALVEKYRRKALALGLDGQAAIVPGEPHTAGYLRGQPVQRRIVQSDPDYAAMIENLDWNIGRVLAALEETGQADNTVVVFASDNGGLSTAEGSPTCNLPLAEGKGWVYKGGTRISQLVRWPAAVRAGTRCDTPVTSCDFYPTFLEAAGLPLQPEQHSDGASLLPLLTGRGELAPRDLFWHYPHYSNQGGRPACSMIAGRWKLIEFFEDGRLELFDLKEDPGERRNLVAEQGALARDLRARLAAWRENVAALVPRPNPNYRELPLSADADDPTA
jgi:arylsulfatase A-like enzyme